jgi:hypothetical protein
LLLLLSLQVERLRSELDATQGQSKLMEQLKGQLRRQDELINSLEKRVEEQDAWQHQIVTLQEQVGKCPQNSPCFLAILDRDHLLSRLTDAQEAHNKTPRLFCPDFHSLHEKDRMPICFCARSRAPEKDPCADDDFVLLARVGR